MSQNANAFYQRAIEKIDRGDFSGAREELEDAINLSPKNIQFRWTRMTLNYSQDLYEFALEDLDILIDWYTDTKSDTYDLIIGSYSESDPRTDETFETDLQNLITKRAVSNEYLGHVDEVMDDLNWLINNGFVAANTYMWRGEYNVTIGDLEAGISDFTSAHQLKPSLVSPLLKRAQTYYKLGSYDQAILDLDKIIESDADPTDKWDAYLWRGRVRFSLGKETEALDDFHSYSQISGHETFQDPHTYIERCFTDT